MTAAIQITLIVPCYNEAKRFLIADYAEALKAHANLHLLFVDDGSQDATRTVLRQFVDRFPRQAGLLSLDQNQGKAEAVRRGVLEVLNRHSPSSEPAFIGYWDADLATPFSELPRFLDIYAERPTLGLVMGARVNLLGRSIERRAIRHYLGRVFATAASLILRLPVYDTQCGAKLFRRTDTLKDLFEKPFVTGWAFDVELLARLSARLGDQKPGELIYELPLLRWKDVAGSKLKARDFAKITISLFRIARHYPRPKIS